VTAPSLKGAALYNAALLGQRGGRNRIETPALVLDRDAFAANIARMATLARDGGLGLRPHAKTHKSAEIGRRQIAEGALGLGCAKPGELMALFDAGIRALMLTTPVASPVKIDALARTAAAGAELSVVVDRPDLVDTFGEAARRRGAAIDVLVDIDVGLKRTGVEMPDAAVALARQISATEGLRYAGVQAYAGRVQHIHDFRERHEANDRAMAHLARVVAALRGDGLPPRIVSGGGTGSHLLDRAPGLITEVQAGSYIFMDEGYRPVDFHGDGEGVFAFSLFVAVTVIAHSSAGFAITDGGSKSFALDGPPPRVLHRGVEIGIIEWCGDEFGRVLPHPGQAAPAIGERLECTVPHCDPTVNLHDVYHVVSGDRLEEFWPVDGRGRAD
jgi:D-serine deaminase-like pyridoxal phosphate-dependent protein